MKLSEINFRDPFFLTDTHTGRYWLYGTEGVTAWEGKPTGLSAYSSPDLVDWDGPLTVFQPPSDFWADRHFWAPEVHYWNGQYVMLVSFKAEGCSRATSLLAADSPEGPFHVVEDSLTPRDWECLDGTLYIEGGNPWLVFCREWLEVGDGQMWAQPLSQKLCPIAEPILLFRASSAPWSTPVGPEGDARVTDGPWLHRLPAGGLRLLWSTHGVGGYSLGMARSETGLLAGPWVQDPEPLFRTDGGHGMLFRTFDKQLLLALHQPNTQPNERPTLWTIRESTETIAIVGAYRLPGLIKAVPLSDVRITGGFWRSRIDSMTQNVIPYQWKALNNEIPDAEPSNAIENFRIAQPT